MSVLCLSNEMKHKVYTVHTIISTLLEEAALATVVLWLLPMFGINIPLWCLILMMAALGAYAWVNYRRGRKALDKKPIISPDVGSRRRTATPISPTGYVRVSGELWRALSSSTINADEEIIVVGMKEMTLLVSSVEKIDHECKLMHPLLSTKY